MATGDPSTSSVGRLLLSVDEATDTLGVGRTLLYELLAPRGPIRTIRLGKRVLVPKAELDRFIEQRLAEAGQ